MNIDKKILFAILIGTFMFTFVSAGSIGSFKQYEEMQITNYCTDGTCTFMNLSSLELPNNTILYLNAEMTKNSQDFNYSYTPGLLGIYTFKTCGNPSGVIVCDSDTFDVTPSGNSGTDNIVFFILIILILYGITFIGFFNRISLMTTLGGMAMTFLGIYMIKNGMLIFRDDLTNYISYITIALGGGLSLWAIVEEIQENF